VQRLPGLPSGARSLALAPDGQTIAFVSGSYPSTRIGTMPLDGGRVRYLTDSSRDVGDPAWSPDGTQMAYVVLSRGEQVGRIFVMSSDGRNSRPVAMGLGPRWSPDGTRLPYWVIGKSGYGVMYVVSSSGGRPVRLGSGATPDWSPDGTKIAFRRDRLDQIGIMNANGTGTPIWIPRDLGNAHIPYPGHPKVIAIIRPSGDHVGDPAADLPIPRIELRRAAV
jgi:Tol biopolymer transport system component